MRFQNSDSSIEVTWTLRVSNSRKPLSFNMTQIFTARSFEVHMLNASSLGKANLETTVPLLELKHFWTLENSHQPPTFRKVDKLFILCPWIMIGGTHCHLFYKTASLTSEQVSQPDSFLWATHPPSSQPISIPKFPSNYWMLIYWDLIVKSLLLLFSSSQMWTAFDQRFHKDR